MIAQIENAILARLKAAADADALGYHWRTLETYPADWDELFKNKRQLNAPAAWTGFGGFSQIGSSHAGPRGEATFGVVVAATNLRNETATRHGGQSPATARPEPGSYQLMLDAVGLLDQQTLGLDIGRLRLSDIRFVDLTGTSLRATSMIAMRFDTNVTIAPLDFDEAVRGDFTTFHANWDLPPLIAAGVPLPADDQTDATDHVEMTR